MVEELNLISQKLNLFKTAEKNAITCIENYISESISFDFPTLRKVSKNNFELSQKSQSLIFLDNGIQTYILRTIIDISLRDNTKDIIGYYQLDVDKNGQFIDEWLIIK